MRALKNSQDLMKFYQRLLRKRNKDPGWKPYDDNQNWVLSRMSEPLDVMQIGFSEQKSLEETLQSAYINKTRERARLKLSFAIANAKDYIHNIYKPYVYKKINRKNFGTSRLVGPHSKERVRLYLIHAIFTVWRQEFEIEPTISRKIVAGDFQTVTSNFVAFAREILALVGIGKAEDHLTLYRSYEKAIFKGLSYEDWRRDRTKNSRALNALSD